MPAMARGARVQDGARSRDPEAGDSAGAPRTGHVAARD
jgi:hypothetical protein